MTSYKCKKCGMHSDVEGKCKLCDDHFYPTCNSCKEIEEDCVCS